MTALEATTETLGLVSQVLRVLRRRRRWPSILLLNAPLGCGVLGAVMALGLISESGRHSSTYYLAVLAGLFIGLSWGALSVFVSFARHSIIVPARRARSRPFWRRNADAMTVGVICAAAGAVLGALATKVL